jgi:hypothetical protein
VVKIKEQWKIKMGNKMSRKGKFIVTESSLAAWG